MASIQYVEVIFMHFQKRKDYCKPNNKAFLNSRNHPQIDPKCQLFDVVCGIGFATNNIFPRLDNCHSFPRENMKETHRLSNVPSENYCIFRLSAWIFQCPIGKTCSFPMDKFPSKNSPSSLVRKGSKASQSKAGCGSSSAKPGRDLQRPMQKNSCGKAMKPKEHHQQMDL